MENPRLDSVIIRDATEEDLPFMNEVYNYNILNSTGLFFTSPVTDEYRLKWFRKLKTSSLHHEPYPCLLGVREKPDGTEVKFGYICYLPWMEGEQFRHVAEVSMYISQEHTGSGLGAKLLAGLLMHQFTSRLRAIIAQITTENTASCKFFLKHGFVYSGQLNNVGYKFNIWLDVVYYTMYLFDISNSISAQPERETCLSSLPIHPTPQVACRDVRKDDLLIISEIQNEKGNHMTINSCGSPITLEQMHTWFERLGSNRTLPCPAILAETGNNQITGYAYLTPVSDRPAYRFTVELHLVVRDRFANGTLLDAVLSHPFCKKFRLISAAIADIEYPVQDQLSSRGFLKSIVYKQLIGEYTPYDDVIIYSFEVKNKPDH